MIIENYIANDFPILGVDTTAEEALQTAVDFDFTHVFVENEGVFQGAVRKECLEENRKKNLEELLHLLTAQVQVAVFLTQVFPCMGMLV